MDAIGAENKQFIRELFVESRRSADASEARRKIQFDRLANTLEDQKQKLADLMVCCIVPPFRDMFFNQCAFYRNLVLLQTSCLMLFLLFVTEARRDPKILVKFVETFRYFPLNHYNHENVLRRPAHYQTKGRDT